MVRRFGKKTTTVLNTPKSCMSHEHLTNECYFSLVAAWQEWASQYRFTSSQRRRKKTWFVKLSWKKTWKTWFTSSCCFFSVCHIGRIPPFNELQKCPFFSYPWIYFLRKFGSFKRYDIPNFHPPPQHGTGFTGHLQENVCLLAAPSKSGGISIEKTLTNGELTGLFPGSI